MEAQEIKAKYTTKATAEKYGVDYEGFAAYMADFGYSVKVGRDFVEVIETDSESEFCGERVDVANFILIWESQEAGWIGELALCEMNSVYRLSDGSYLDSEEVEIPGYPLHIKRALKN